MGNRKPLREERFYSALVMAVDRLLRVSSPRPSSRVTLLECLELSSGSLGSRPSSRIATTRPSPTACPAVSVVYLALFLFSIAASAQTNIQIPAASGAGIKSTLPERFGINLDDSYNYGNNQLTANLLASDSWNFAPMIWQTSSSCSYVQNGNQWIDRNGYSPWIGNFAYGANYQIVSGPSLGQTGYITDMRPSTGAQGVQYTLSNNFISTPSCVENSPDQMIWRCLTPNTTCATGYNASDVTGMNLTTNGGASPGTFETTDRSPSSGSLQAMQLVAPGTQEAGVQAIFEGLLFYKSYINLNGTYQLTFRAKATSGTPTLFYSAYRTGGTVFTSGSVIPTVNATPNAGWQNYVITFTASETGTQVEDGSVWLDAQGGTVLLQDMTLTEQPAGGNTTVFRNAVYQKLLAMHPGILRDMTVDSWGCSPDNMMQAVSSARLECGFNSYVNFPQPIAYGWSDFMTLAHAVAADPWITISPYSTAQDMVNITAYMSGTCGNGNAYTTMRCNYGQTTPWTSVFSNIYLEMGNEVWNSPNGVNLWTGGGQAYGGLVASNVTAFKGSAYYTSNQKFVASGFILGSNYAYGWNWTVMCSAAGMVNCSGPVTSPKEPDLIDGAPYWFNDMTDFTNVFGPMFAEPFNFALSTGATYGLQNYTSSNFPGVNGAIYETNMSTLCTITGTSQATINGYGASTGSAINSLNGMMLAADVGVGPQVFFALPEIANGMGLSATGNSGACSTAASYTPYAPIWGSNLFMPGPNNSTSTDRPSGIALQMVNSAIGNNLNVLNLTVTGTPTYNQPAAQPNPTSYPTPGAMSIAANPAVPYVSAHAYSDGAGHYTLVVVNDNQSATEAITFAGAAAPTGIVTKTVLSGTTQTNDPGTVIPSPVVTYPNSTTLSSPTSDTLAISSLTTYTWTTGGGPPTASPPTFTPPGGTYPTTQSVAISSSSGGAILCGNTTNSPAPSTNGTTGCGSGSTLYSGPISVASSETLYYVAGGTGYADSAVNSAAYAIHPQAATPTFSPVGGPYTTPQTVTITSSTGGAYKCYNNAGGPRTDGAGGCAVGALYSGPISIASSQTVYAVAGCVGCTDSAVASAAYAISGAAATPTFSPAGGSYVGPQAVTISSATGGVSIYYTTDGSTPTTGSTLYTTPVAVNSSLTIKAIATGGGYSTSPVGTAPYVIDASAAAPTFSPVGGNYTSPQTVTPSTSSTGCGPSIVWNFTNAQTGGNLTSTSTGPIPVNSSLTVYGQVQGCSGFTNSPISSATYSIGLRTFYIRPGGGNRYDANVPAGQCDGLGDADYVSGVNQHCAFNQLQYMWDDQTSAGAEIWAMSSGDHVIIRGCAAGANQPYNASPGCRIGWDNNVSPGNANWCKGGSNGGCHNPPIPPGTSTQHTQILGANYAACTKSNSQVIFGGFGVSWALDLTGGAKYVDLECITDTSHTQVVSGTPGICITHGTTVGNVPAACITSVGSTLSDYDGNGIETDNTTANILMQDMWITGHTASGLQGPIGGAIIWNRVFVGFNGFAGWNFDDGSATPDAAGSTFAGSYVTMLGNGCNSEYPVVDTFPGLYCFDLNSGGFGDSFSGQQTNLQSFTCDHCTTNFNTKDGMIGPHTFLANLSYTNSSWTGNMGQQWKWNSQTNSTAQMLNNVVNANCYRMSQPITGWPSSFNHYLTLYCRANADVASYSSAPGSSVLIANNTFTTYEKQIFDLGATTTGQCGTATQIFENNLFWGVTVATNYFPGASGSAPAVYFLSDGTCTYTPSYNLEFGVRNGSCPGSTFVCTDPLLNGEPAPGGIPPESAMDVFAPISPGFQPSSSSPAIHAGITYTGQLGYDFYGTPLTRPPWIGAVAPPFTPPVTTVGVGGGIILSNGIMIGH